MGIEEIVQGKRQEILRLAAEHGAKHVRVFGSFARGDAIPTSDVDILVEMESGRTLFDLIELSQSLEALLGRKVDIVTEPSLSPYLRDQILDEAVAV